MVFSKRTGPHKVASAPALLIRNHSEAGVTQRRPIFIDPDGVWDCFGAATSAVKVDKSTDTASFEETLSGYVVYGSIQTHIFTERLGICFPYRGKR